MWNTWKVLTVILRLGPVPITQAEEKPEFREVNHLAEVVELIDVPHLGTAALCYLPNYTGC